MNQTPTKLDQTQKLILTLLLIAPFLIAALLYFLISDPNFPKKDLFTVGEKVVTNITMLYFVIIWLFVAAPITFFSLRKKFLRQN